MEAYDPSQSGNYYILGDSNAEMVHLVETDRYFNKAIGGLMPEQSEQSLSGIYHVLDVACGPGGWALGVAQAYPDMQVTGIDISSGMINYATVQAHASGLDNVRFEVANVLEPLAFPDEAFDLVNARHLEGVIPVAVWPSLLREMFRVTRPGGTIRITDSEWGVSNSFANERLLELAIKTMQATGLSHSPDGRNYAVTQMLSRFLQDVGCVNIQERPSFMDFSAGSEVHRSGSLIFTIGYEIMEPFLLAANLVTAQELEKLRRQQTVELLDDRFRGIVYILTAWGQKP